MFCCHELSCEMVSPFTNAKYLTLFSVIRKFGPLLYEQLGNPSFVALQSDNVNRRISLGLYISSVFVTATSIGSKNKFTI